MKGFRAVNLKKVFLLVGDIVILYASLFLMLFIRYTNITDGDPMNHLRPFSILFIFWLLIFFIIGLYELRELKNTVVFGKRMASAIFISLIFSILFFYFIPYFQITPKTNLFIFLIIFASATYAWRITYNNILIARSPREKTLLIGKSTATETLARHIEENPQLGYELSFWMKDTDQDIDIAKLKEHIKKHGANLIVIPSHSRRDARELAILHKRAFADVALVDLVELYEVMFGKIPLEEIGHGSFLESITGHTKMYDAFKRPLEILFSSLLFLITLPLFILIGILIKLTSPGSAFFTQTRFGKNGKPFTLWKFRTMVTDAEKNGPQWAKENDARITPVGRILRKTHLDELPQLWNIMRGDLSLVGPRPERPEFIATLEKEIPYYHLRHVIRPGLTGWAQINYRYGASTSDAHEKLQYDMFYVKNRSLWFDATTVIKTIKRLFINPK